MFWFLSNFLTLAMSRVEAVAALAPGVFPLLVQHLEHFDDTVWPFKRCKTLQEWQEAELLVRILPMENCVWRCRHSRLKKRKHCCD